jgi:hypothetical protein
VHSLGLSPGLAILNRALPPSVSVAPADVAASGFLRYVEHYRSLQTRVAAELAGNFSRVLSLPESGRVDLQGADGLDGLADLGATFIAQGLA